MITSRYKLINNVVGWVVFAIALITYWLTLEPTASYWDCGEFIIQADKLEIGHPPGNPIFMLTARFFANFASSQQTVALMVNAMSGLLSALTILLLFWTITHLVRRLLVRDGSTAELSVGKYLAIMGSGVVGALAYAWSDTFWFSAVEAEVYAFSSFCTALVFWLILKWENRADEPHSDRWLILIAYIIGVSVAVHLLNLLCIPAIALVFAYKRFKNMNVAKSLGVLGVSFAIIVLVLYGMVPGMMKVAQMFELLMVNGFQLPFNTGTVVYALLAFGLMVWSLYELYRQRSATMIRISFLAAICLSGVLAFTNSVWVWILLAIVLAVVLWSVFRRGLPLRQMSVIMWSVMMIFVGISSYALILIRSNADTPMNQSSPDNVFDLASYLNREQYGETPLFYGRTYQADNQKLLRGYDANNLPVYSSVIKSGAIEYAKKIDGANLPQMRPEDKEEFDAGNFKLSQRSGDAYVSTGRKVDVVTNPELNILFPRIYSNMPSHVTGYEQWVPELTDDKETRLANTVDLMAVDENGNEMGELDMTADPIQVGEGMYSFPAKRAFRPSQSQNLKYFFRYQLNHMYFRYFMWNFAGRQNDINNQGGDLDAGNWLSGIPFIDNARLGDQSLLPDDLGKNNRGHNVYYMLPLLLGLIGLLWQAFAGKKGVEQFWVVFFLFFMTGIAIIFYLNQTPYQPRERDYAYAGSFYAFAIWIGMGVAALWRIIIWAAERKRKQAGAEADEEPTAAEPVSRPLGLWAGVVACVLGILVPLQMVSQTWDDHDRSGRTAARDFAINFLESTEPNAIIFCNGDNDTFPLWYAQEVEGVRTDVRVINLSYLASDWYALQFFMPAYNGAAVPLTIQPKDLAYSAMAACYVNTANRTPMNLMDALKQVYAGNGRDKYGYAQFPTSVVYVPINKELMVQRGYVTAAEAEKLADRIEIDLTAAPSYRAHGGYLSAADVVVLDIIATNAAQGWPRPIYWCVSVGTDYYLGLDTYQATSGLTLQLVPWKTSENTPLTSRNVKLFNDKFLWGGADTQGRTPYYDETAGRMVTTMRQSMQRTAAQLYREGEALAAAGDNTAARAKYADAARTVELMLAKLPRSVYPYEMQIVPEAASILANAGTKLGDAKMKARGLNLLKELLLTYAQYVIYQDNIRLTFGDVQLSYNSKTVPLRYWQFVEMYRNAGGDWDALVKANPILQKLNQETLQQNWEEVKGYFDPNFSATAQHINDMAKVVVKLQGLPAEEYAKASDNDRQVDSLFYSLLISPATYGFTPEDVEKATLVPKVDRTRAKRLYEQFCRNHPDVAAQ